MGLALTLMAKSALNYISQRKFLFTVDSSSYVSRCKDFKFSCRRYFHLKKLFRVWDRNDDGFIEIEEIEEAYMIQGRHYTEAKGKELMEAEDVIDGDGKISREEFIKNRTM